jgi:hypothetical protein
MPQLSFRVSPGDVAPRALGIVLDHLVGDGRMVLAYERLEME